MRKKIINLAIWFINPLFGEEIFRSLRFSTHVNIFIFKNSAVNFNDTDYCKVINIDQNESTLLELLKKRNIKLVFIANKKISIEILKKIQDPMITVINQNKIKHSKKLQDLSFLKKKKIDYDFIKLIKKNSYNFLESLNQKTNFIHDEFILESFKDINGDIQYTGLIIFVKKDQKKTYYSFDLENQQILNITNSFFSEIDYKGLLSIKFKLYNYKETNLLFKSIQIKNIHEGWRFNRARGINFPLLLIQNFLSREIIVHPLVDKKLLYWSENNKIYLKVNYSLIFIDLDETLIINEKSVSSTLELIKIEKKRNKKVYLITRHKKNILSTLLKTKIHDKYFNKIIFVNDGEKKSDFINNELKQHKLNHLSIFIDNEFPERYDVDTNCDVIVFDVNGLDFLKPEYLGDSE